MVYSCPLWSVSYLIAQCQPKSSKQCRVLNCCSWAVEIIPTVLFSFMWYVSCFQSILRFKILLIFTTVNMKCCVIAVKLLRVNFIDSCPLGSVSSMDLFENRKSLNQLPLSQWGDHSARQDPSRQLKDKDITKSRKSTAVSNHTKNKQA